MPFFENDPLSRKRQQNILFLLGAMLFPAVAALLFFGQAYMDKRRLLSNAQEDPTATLATHPPPDSGSLDQPRLAPASLPGQPPADPAAPLLSDAFLLMEQKQFVAALEKVNAAIQASPQNAAAYGLRGNIYAEEKLWDQAGQDYRASLRLDDKNTKMKFDLAEVQFRQMNYDDARPGFLALEQDPDLGDLATYKVFLCDLLAAHEDVAAKELDTFNQVGSNASFYFANIAWYLIHHKTEEARSWLASAQRIYAPKKVSLYSTSLTDLGYLPLPPPQQ